MPHRLNLKHLHYFWMIARTGSIAQAAEQLGLTAQTLSSQLGSLEEATGPLFHRKGRGLQLTALGEALKNPPMIFLHWWKRWIRKSEAPAAPVRCHFAPASAPPSIN